MWQFTGSGKASKGIFVCVYISGNSRRADVQYSVVQRFSSIFIMETMVLRLLAMASLIVNGAIGGVAKIGETHDSL